MRLKVPTGLLDHYKPCLKLIILITIKTLSFYLWCSKKTDIDLIALKILLAYASPMKILIVADSTFD
jgi:hypothetical protein